MPISSQITSVDTLQVKSATEAFVQGYLPTHDGTLLGTVASPDLWGTSPLNWGLMALCIIFILIFFRRFISIFPHISRGMIRWKEVLTMENNMRLSRERDSVAAVAVPVICVCVSRLDLFHASYIDPAEPGMKTLIVSGMILGFLLVRGMISLMLPARKLRSETARAAGRTAYNFIIVLSVVLLALTVVHSLSRSCAVFSVKAALISSGVLWGLFLLRKYQIMASDAGHFAAFLYLCAVEILPAAMLVVSMFPEAVRELVGMIPTAITRS